MRHRVCDADNSIDKSVFGYVHVRCVIHTYSIDLRGLYMLLIKSILERIVTYSIDLRDL